MNMTYTPGHLRSHRARAGLALAALTIGTVGLVACTDDNNVVTMKNSKNGSEQATSDQGRRAQEFYDCLKAAKLPATISDPDTDGQRYVYFEPPSQGMIFNCSDNGCGMTAGDNVTESAYDDAWKQAEKYADKDGNYTQGVLFIDGEDHSEAYDKCLKSSEYTEPEYKADPAEELKQKQAQAKVNAEWTACARENGLPNLKDPDPPKADNWATMGNIMLPGDMTEDALKALVAKCPTFDPEAAAAADQAMAEDPASLGLGYVSPSFDFTQSEPQVSEGADPMDDPQWAHIEALREIIYKAQNDYYENLFGEGGIDGPVATAAIID